MTTTTTTTTTISNSQPHTHAQSQSLSPHGFNYVRKVSFDNFDPPTVIDDFDNNSPYYSIKHISSKPTKVVHPNKPNHKPILKIKEADKDTILPFAALQSNKYDNSYIPPENLKTNSAANAKHRKKSLVEMTDEEILALDEQFRTRKINLSSFQFENDQYTVPYANADNWAPNKYSQKLGELDLDKTEYPTNPVMPTKNSVCLRFQHPLYAEAVDHLLSTGHNPKYYMCALNATMESWAALDYYLEKVGHDGDTLIVSFSVNDDNNLNELAHKLASVILQKVATHDSQLKIALNVEFFNTSNYVNDIVNLYMPSMVIVGCKNYKKRRASSIMTNKNYVPVIYMSPEDVDAMPNLRHHGGSKRNTPTESRSGSSSSTASTDVTATGSGSKNGNSGRTLGSNGNGNGNMVSSGGVSFNQPFGNKTTTTNTQIPVIQTNVLTHQPP
ncbi:unnamed protein product [Ambrosiozyma monospora]|uniref:Unnamed protein product n=1 Tax=Ambrosiozyma monospora TaxID=43982 RepID=A0ACB5TJH1_AMBMO|nr:unnamed protein product [Ambrosiozyma monospora]